MSDSITTTDILDLCWACPGSDQAGHTGDCWYTWQNPEWLNREQVWSHRAGAWVWRTLPTVVQARTTEDLLASIDTEVNLHIRDDKQEAAFLASMVHWNTEEDLEHLLLAGVNPETLMG